MKFLSGHGLSNDFPGEEFLSGELQVVYSEALRGKINWYYSTKNRDQVRAILDHLLTE